MARVKAAEKESPAARQPCADGDRGRPSARSATRTVARRRGEATSAERPPSLTFEAPAPRRRSRSSRQRPGGARRACGVRQGRGGTGRRRGRGRREARRGARTAGRQPRRREVRAAEPEPEPGAHVLAVRFAWPGRWLLNGTHGYRGLFCSETARPRAWDADPERAPAASARGSCRARRRRAAPPRRRRESPPRRNRHDTAAPRRPRSPSPPAWSPRRRPRQRPPRACRRDPRTAASNPA